jgi:hypothetical protein
MTNRLRAAALVAAACLLLPAAASARTVPNPKGTVIVGKGELVKFTFQVSGGVGISWAYKSDSAPNVFRLLSVKTKSNSSNPMTVGGYSTKTFTFRARNGGTARIKFVRNFRGSKTTRTVKVIVATEG